MPNVQQKMILTINDTDHGRIHPSIGLDELNTVVGVLQQYHPRKSSISCNLQFPSAPFLRKPYLLHMQKDNQSPLGQEVAC